MASRFSRQTYANGQKTKPTMWPMLDFDAEVACKELRNAMKGLGTDENTIVRILGSCSSEQRCEIKCTYKATFGKDLVEELKSELSGDFLQLCRYCIMPWYDMYADALYDAMAGCGTKESVIVETLCTLNGDEIEEVKEAYNRLLQEKGKDKDRDLEKDILDDLSGDFECLMVAILQGKRKEFPDEDVEAYVNGCKLLTDLVDMDKVFEDVQEIYEAGEGRFGTDEATFISKFCMRNQYELWAISATYEEQHGKTLLQAVDCEFSGDMKRALKLLFQTQMSPQEAFSGLLHDAMKGWGTSDKKLMRIIVGRSEVDLGDIMVQYEEDTGKTLIESIKSETSGDYRALLLALCGETSCD